MFENLKRKEGQTCWEASEAALFVMVALAKNILP
jgi:hypothetical protein